MTSLSPLTPSDVDPAILAGAKVVIAGKCCLGMFRKELERVLTAAGGVLSEVVSAKSATFIVTPRLG
jgi:NAD-dependent DNA ligase